jgi:protein TonB
MDGAPIFHGPIIRGHDVPLRLRRGFLFGLTAIAYLSAALVLVLANLLVVETMTPPKAVSGSVIVFRPPAPLQGGPVGGPAHHSTAGTAPAATPTVAPSLRYPVPRPTVIPLPPPSGTLAETDDTDTPVAEGWDSGAPGMDSTGDGGPGGPGRGSGGPGGGGTGGGGSSMTGGGDPVYDEHHPDITPPVQRASRAYPRYPDLARKAGVQGTVVLLIVIGADGRVGEIEVLRTPDPRFGFDLAAIEAVKQWRYRPALLGGRPVAVQASVTFEFTLSR